MCSTCCSKHFLPGTNQPTISYQNTTSSSSNILPRNTTHGFNNNILSRESTISNRISIRGQCPFCKKNATSYSKVYII